MGNICVRLTNGDKFEMDAHGIWMTTPEANTLFNNSPPENEPAP
jgi:hypothetical protein